MLRSKFLSRISTIVLVLMLALGNVIPAFAVGTNDNFANATQINSLPYNVNADNSGATSEAGESNPCGSGFNPSSVWFVYTPSTNVSLTARVSYYNFPTVLAVYTGSSLGNLVQVGCSQYYYNTTFQAQGGTTYYFQVSGYYDFYQGTIPFSLEVTPPPQASFYFYPSDPSVFDTVTFCDNSYDPGGQGIQSLSWNFGDSSTSTVNCASHQYANDGAYTVQHTVTTFDGRSGSISQVVQVRTRDVAINKLSIPNTAKVNTTKSISVDVTNKRYSDNVQVQLFKGLPGGGEQLIGTLTIYVPVRATRPTTFKFSYTFTPSDATVGKVTFRAVATLVSGRDALPADNTAIGTTLVIGGTSYP